MAEQGGRDQMPVTSAAKLTYDDFLRFPDDGLRHELIDGEHIVTPSPFERHQAVSLELTLALGNFLKVSRLGRLYAAPFDIVLSRYDVVEPDLLVVLADQLDILTAKHIHGAPALMVEILSSGTRRRDLTKKRALYERSGVREYWLVDPDQRVITICRRATDGSLPIVETLAATSEDTLTSPLLPGFSVGLTPLFDATYLKGRGQRAEGRGQRAEGEGRGQRADAGTEFVLSKGAASTVDDVRLREGRRARRVRACPSSGRPMVEQGSHDDMPGRRRSEFGVCP